jgi:RNA polymerase sigma factor (sigma-70 family)
LRQPTQQAPSLALSAPGSAEAADKEKDDEIASYYARHRERVIAFLVRGCGCPADDAPDIVQDTIMAIRKRYWPTVRALDKPEAYWFKIAERRYHRIKGREAGRAAVVDPSDGVLEPMQPGDPYTGVDDRHALAAVLRQLPRRQRQVLWLRFTADFSEADIAKTLDISTGSVKKHLSKAKEQMGRKLAEDRSAWEAGAR